MNESTRWEAGSTITLQEVWDGKLWSARPVIVVEDSADQIALWCPKGTGWKVATTPPGREWLPTRVERFVQRMTDGDWILGDFTWRVSNLMLLRPGDRHAVWVGWLDDWQSFGWYVNIQRPFVRTARALQTMDLMLDVVVEPDRSWHYKDEDELTALASAGLIEPQEEARIWEEARRTVTRIEGNAPPFNEPWHEWRPDPAWNVPRLPAGWDMLSEE